MKAASRSDFRSAPVPGLNLSNLARSWLASLDLRRAETPADKDTRMPPRGIPVPPAVRAELESGVRKLGDEIEGLRTAPQIQTKTIPFESLPDVRIYYTNAVRYALEARYLL